MQAILASSYMLSPEALKAGPALQLVADATVMSFGVAAAPPSAFKRASSPLRKHKRKAQPSRAALDVADVAAEPAPLASSSSSDDDSLSEGSRKERRGSASPDISAQRSSRPVRLQRAVSAPHPPGPAPDQLVAAFEAPVLPPPPFLAAATAAAAGAPKVCVQCGTMTTPMWRTVNGLTYCNADGLRLKRKLGLL
ncbi:hypothetical protein ABPG77_003434 [Micractinium sp. CCAP 211/92]